MKGALAYPPSPKLRKSQQSLPCWQPRKDLERKDEVALLDMGRQEVNSQTRHRWLITIRANNFWTRIGKEEMKAGVGSERQNSI